ncbi:MAG: hypothetical protein V4542_04515 [Pseudomonadota bacterium]
MPQARIQAGRWLEAKNLTYTLKNVEKLIWVLTFDLPAMPCGIFRPEKGEKRSKNGLFKALNRLQANEYVRDQL